MRKKNYKNLFEATADKSGSSGSYVPPLQPGERPFEKSQLEPFNISVSDYKSPLVQYDSYDHQWDLRSKQIKKLEKIAKKVTNYIKHHPYATFSDDEGGVINQNPSGRRKKEPFNLEIVPIERKVKKINEADTTISAGAYNGPIELGLKKWKKNLLTPFTIEVDHTHNESAKNKSLRNNIKKVVGMWEKGRDGI